MAEVVGIIGTVATLASEGIKLSNALHSFYKSAKNAERDVIGISKELKNTAVVLHQLESILKEEARLCSNEFYESLAENIDDCRVLFKEIGNLLARFGSERKGNGSVTENSLGAKFALKWPLNSVEVKQLCIELEKFKSNINLKLGVIRYQREVHESQIADRRREALEKENTYNVRIEKHNIEILKLRTRIAQEKYENMSKQARHGKAPPNAMAQPSDAARPDRLSKGKSGTKMEKCKPTVSFSIASSEDKHRRKVRHDDAPHTSDSRSVPQHASTRRQFPAISSDRDRFELNKGGRDDPGHSDTFNTSSSKKVVDDKDPPNLTSRANTSEALRSSFAGASAYKRERPHDMNASNVAESTTAQTLLPNGHEEVLVSKENTKEVGKEIHPSIIDSNSADEQMDLAHIDNYFTNGRDVDVASLTDDSGSETSAHSKTFNDDDTSAISNDARHSDMLSDYVPNDPSSPNVSQPRRRLTINSPSSEADNQTENQSEEANTGPGDDSNPNSRHNKSDLRRSPLDRIRPWFRTIQRIGGTGHKSPESKKKRSSVEKVSDTKLGDEGKRARDHESSQSQQIYRSRLAVTEPKGPYNPSLQQMAPAIDQRWPSSSLFPLPTQNPPHFRPFEGPPFETRNVGDRIIHEMMPIYHPSYDEKTILELWQFRRLTTSSPHDRSWGHVTRHYLPVDSSELQLEIKKFKRWNRSVTRAFNRLTTYQQRQVHLLLYERNRYNYSWRYRWTIQTVKTFPKRSKPAACTSMQVILERRDTSGALHNQSPNSVIPQPQPPLQLPPAPEPQRQPQTQTQPQPQPQLPTLGGRAPTTSTYQPHRRPNEMNEQPGSSLTERRESGTRVLAPGSPRESSMPVIRSKKTRFVDTSESSDSSDTDSLFNAHHRHKGKSLKPKLVEMKSQQLPEHFSRKNARRRPPGRSGSSTSSGERVIMNATSSHRKRSTSFDRRRSEPLHLPRKEKPFEESIDDLISRWTLTDIPQPNGSEHARNLTKVS